MHNQRARCQQQPLQHTGSMTATHLFGTLVPVEDSSTKLRMASAMGGGTCLYRSALRDCAAQRSCSLLHLQQHLHECQQAPIINAQRTNCSIPVHLIRTCSTVHSGSIANALQKSWRSSPGCFHTP